MEKFVPYEKMSKKQKREYDNRKRKDWGSFNPATRRTPSSQDYKNKRDEERMKGRE